MAFLSRQTFANFVSVARKRSWPDVAANHKGDIISKGHAKRSSGSAINHTGAHYEPPSVKEVLSVHKKNGV
jgi:hypothetical protein